MRWAVAAAALGLLAGLGSAQESARGVLTNHDVETLADAGFGEQFIIEVIGSSRPDFDTSADGIAELKKHGVKEAIIRAMRIPHPADELAAKPAFESVAQPIRVFLETNPNSQAYTAEVVETFAKGCPSLTVTSRRETAAFLMLLDRTPGKLLRPAASRMVVFDRGGDTIYGSQRPLEKAVRGFCAAAQRAAPLKAESSQTEGHAFPR
jgi:hypothetical protein